MESSTRESRVRREAARIGYHVRKSRKRDFDHDGKFMLLDDRRACVLGSWYDATLDQIESYLHRVSA
jgi:hypothetical protein